MLAAQFNSVEIHEIHRSCATAGREAKDQGGLGFEEAFVAELCAQLERYGFVIERLCPIGCATCEELIEQMRNRA